MAGGFQWSARGSALGRCVGEGAAGARGDKHEGGGFVAEAEDAGPQVVVAMAAFAAFAAGAIFFAARLVTARLVAACFFAARFIAAGFISAGAVAIAFPARWA